MIRKFIKDKFGLTLFTRYDILDEASGEVYLRRWVLISCSMFRIFLHRIYREDKDRHLHNHPFNALCIVLRGSYSQLIRHPAHETEGCRVMVEDVLFFNFLYRTLYHKIISVNPKTLTLVIAGPKYRDWGFWKDDKHIPWRTYLGLPEKNELDD